MKIREGIGGEGGRWFEESIQRMAGIGFTTYFWTDCWVGEVPFQERFRHLFYLSVHEDMTVAEMYFLGWGEGGNAWGGAFVSLGGGSSGGV